MLAEVMAGIKNYLNCIEREIQGRRVRFDLAGNFYTKIKEGEGIIGFSGSVFAYVPNGHGPAFCYGGNDDVLDIACQMARIAGRYDVDAKIHSTDDDFHISATVSLSQLSEEELAIERIFEKKMIKSSTCKVR